MRVVLRSPAAAQIMRGTGAGPGPYGGDRAAAEGAAPHGRRAGTSPVGVALPGRRLIVALTIFSSITAMAGGTALVLSRAGNEFFPLSLVAHTPFTSLLVPGLLLGVVVGGTSLACAMLAWRRSRAAVDATMLAGGALAVWILAEVAMLRGFHGLQAIYGTLGVATLALGVRAAWRSGVPRHRWVILVTLAETVGFLVPACAGIIATRAGVGGVTRAGLVIGAGLIEGLALGAGQAPAFPLPVRKTPYSLLTAVGAGVVWSSVMVLMLVVRSGAVPVPVVVLAGALTAVVGLAAIGSLQWIELRHHARRAHRWIPWTALAWTLALPFSFAPGPFVDESTPLGAHIALWGCGGLLMAFVMALVTWQGVRRLRGGGG